MQPRFLDWRNEAIPTPGYDWWDYGGIVRDVWLTVSGPIRVNRQQIRTHVKGGQAAVDDQIILESYFPQQKQFVLSITAFGPDGNATAHESRTIDVAPGTTPTTIATCVRSPELWGIDHPNLYRMTFHFWRRPNRTESRSRKTELRSLPCRSSKIMVTTGFASVFSIHRQIFPTI